jgi:hypothetical protein
VKLPWNYQGERRALAPGAAFATRSKEFVPAPVRDFVNSMYFSLK